MKKKNSSKSYQFYSFSGTIFFSVCNTDKGKLIAFEANLQNTLQNLPLNTMLKFENVRLNYDGQYNPKHGIFTAPADGVYSFTWTFLSKYGRNVYDAAEVDNVVQVKSCIYKQTYYHMSMTGHLLTELKRGNKVWLQIIWIPAMYIHGDNYTYFSGYRFN